MPILTQPAFGAKLSIAFITGGALVDVWVLVWRYTIAQPELPPTQKFLFWGLVLTGLTFLTIGAFLGRIGRAARKAEMPPTDEAVRAEAAVQANAAANPATAAAVLAPGMVAVPPAAVAPPAGVVPTTAVVPGMGS